MSADYRNGCIVTGAAAALGLTLFYVVGISMPIAIGALFVLLAYDVLMLNLGK